PAAAFLTTVMDEAERRGHVISWGTVCFSVRARHPVDGSLLTFAYGYTDKLEVYLAYLPTSKEEIGTLRKDLLACGVFRESGQHTLTVPLHPEVMAVLPGVFQTVLNRVGAALAPKAVEVN